MESSVASTSQAAAVASLSDGQASAQPTRSQQHVARAPKSGSKASAPKRRRGYMNLGDNVLIRLPSGLVKTIKIAKQGNISLGKYGTFKAADLIDKPYGPTYEIVEDGLQVLKVTLKEIEETAANNENISSTGAQKLSFVDIDALRKEGVHGQDIIAKQIEEHAAFELKTEYSKDKYRKRKEAKYLHVFTPIEPTVHNICEYNFEKQSSKIREMRADTLSQVMTMANVRPGAKLLVVDDVHGLIVAAAVERMGGEGRIMVINGKDSPPDLHLLDSFNFDPADTELIRSLNFASTQPSWTIPDLPTEVEDPSTVKNSREWAKLRKRKNQFDRTEATREEFFAGGFDGVILACEYEPYSVLEQLLPSIGGSAPVLVYTPFLSVLYDLQTRLRNHPEFLAPNISEPSLRKYQVLPGRTHPEMNGMPHGGYILSTTRVIDDAQANSVQSFKRAIKKRKLEQQAARESTEGTDSSQ